MNARLSGFVATMLLAASLAASGAWAADRPPKALHWTGDHWTAWNPPPVPAPPSTVQIHVVVRGDTLWGLAAKNYGNPYLWPQLWEKNKYILDAHWIYPGDPLVLGPQVTPAEQLAAARPAGAAGETPTAETPGEAPEAPSAPTPGVLTAGAAARAPIPLGAESDIYCSGYIGDPGEQFPYAIVGSEYDVMSPLLSGHAGADIQGTYGTVNTVKYGLYTGDIVYLDGGRARGLTAGTTFTAVASRQEVHHPVDHHLIGRFYRYLGRVRVLSVQETTAIAEIVHACDPITG